MRKTVFLLLSLVFTTTTSSQVTFVVNELPKNHNYDDPIYISGDFEGWTGGIEAYKLKQENKSYTISLPIKDETTLYKFTMGNWQTVERDKNGTHIDNRVYKFKKEVDTVYLKIASWQGEDASNKSSASRNVSIISESFKIPELNTERRVWIYLPPGYKNSEEKYPVLYMHDGQNLFDKSTAYSGEWEVDETLNKLFQLHNFKLIVIGVDNGGEKRLDEYSPWKNEKYGGGEGEAYTNFLVKTLKPYIDKNYKTQPSKENTGIMGSSMGGLISHYAGLKHPDVFGKVGVYSPAFWFAPEVNDFSKTNGNLKNTQMYFLAGGQEGSNVAFNEINQTVKDMNSVVETLRGQGFPDKHIISKVVPQGKHNEEFWRNSFEETILWLFKDSLKPIRTFVSVSQETKNEVKVKVSDGLYKIRFYSSEIVETTFIPNGQKFKEGSHAVVLKPEEVSVEILDTSKEIEMITKGISVKIQKESFKITYLYNGEEVTSERNGYRKIDDLETIQFNLTKDEVLYGGGARALGMNRRGNRLQLYNKAHYGYEERSELMNYTMPVVVSSKQYMIHFDNAPIGYLDLDSKANNTLTYETISGRKTYQVIVGNSWLNLIDNYTNLTGKQPLPPRWVLGNFASRFGYHSQEETERVVNTFKDLKIPLDAVIIDIYWFGKDIKGYMGNLEWLKDSFPEPQKMIKNFKYKGVNSVLVTEPFVLSTSKRWDDAVKENVLAKDSVGNPARYEFYFGNTGIIDVYNPKAKQWFWNIYKDLANQGVSGIWGDLGEPEVHPEWVKHATGTANEVHNTYGHDWAKLIYEGYKRDFPETRPFILMRAGYSGSQHYGMIPWSGDVNRTWGGFHSQPEIALQMGIQGLAYMHSDLGGFAGANLDNELYTRWLQYGVFQPIYRPHAQEEVPSEPIFREKKTRDLAKQSIELRYKLLPYNYNLLFENNQTGAPLMRPLFFEESSNNELLNYSKTYLWGDNILVSPVMEAEKNIQEVYFPKDSYWFDFYSDEKIKGGQTKSINLKENSIPTFVRGGTFIPMAKPIQSTSEYDGRTLELHYYFEPSVKNNEEALYNDDGLTADAFEKGKFERLNFKYKDQKKWMVFEFNAQTGRSYQTNTKQIDLIIHNVNWNPKKIKVNGKSINGNWDNKNDRIIIPFTWNTSKRIELKLKNKN